MSVPEVILEKQAICMLNYDEKDFFKVVMDSSIQKGRGLKYTAVYSNQLADLERNEAGLGPQAQRVRYRSIKVLYQIEGLADTRIRSDGQITAAATKLAKDFHLAEVAEYAKAEASSVKKQKASDAKATRSAQKQRSDDADDLPALPAKKSARIRSDDFEDLPALPVKKNYNTKRRAAVEDAGADDGDADEDVISPVPKKRQVRVKDEEEEDAKRAAKRARLVLEDEDEDEDATIMDY